MKHASCSRIWQAEAAEDGRLAGTDLASFERHAEACSECAREWKALARLRRELATVPTPASTPLERRRLRAEVLKQADAARLGGASPSARRFFVAALVTAAFVVAAGVVLRWRTPPIAEPVVSVPAFQMDPSAGAEWQMEERGSTIRQRVVRGRFAFHVDKLEHGQRFIVRLPDGELEVKGTSFVVEVGAAGTENVSCSEGRVALRLAGHDDVLLSAGDAWPPRDARIDPPSAATATPATPASAPSASVAPPTPRAPAPSAVPSSPGEDFVEAMGAFSEGDLGRAEKLFVAFEQKHPSDARVEDAAFLRAVARAKRGDKEGARELALDYLRRYPKGLRQLEAEQLAR